MNKKAKAETTVVTDAMDTWVLKNEYCSNWTSGENFTIDNVDISLESLNQPLEITFKNDSCKVEIKKEKIVKYFKVDDYIVFGDIHNNKPFKVIGVDTDTKPFLVIEDLLKTATFTVNDIDISKIETITDTKVSYEKDHHGLNNHNAVGSVSFEISKRQKTILKDLEIEKGTYFYISL